MTSDTSELQAILHRVHRGERQNRRLKETGVLALALIGTLILIGRSLAKNRIAGANPFSDLGSAESLHLPTSTARWQEDATGAGQSYGSYPTKNALVTALKDADYALRRFEEVAGQINFSRYDAPHVFVDAARHHLEATLGKAHRTKARIDELQAGNAVSGFGLFEVYDGLTMTETCASELGSDLRLYVAKPGSLPSELYDVSTLVVKASSNLRDILWNQIQAEESELEACHSKPKQ